MAHTCHAIGCSRRVPPRMLFCGPHWELTPKPIRVLVWSTYRLGQEIRKDPSAAYIVAQAHAVAAVARLESRFTDEQASCLIFEAIGRAGDHNEERLQALRVEFRKLDPNGEAWRLATGGGAAADHSQIVRPASGFHPCSTPRVR